MDAFKAGFDLRWSRKWSHKRNRIGVRRILTFPFSSNSAYDSISGVPELEA